MQDIIDLKQATLDKILYFVDSNRLTIQLWHDCCLALQNMDTYDKHIFEKTKAKLYDKGVAFLNSNIEDSHDLKLLSDALKWIENFQKIPAPILYCDFDGGRMTENGRIWVTCKNYDFSKYMTYASKYVGYGDGVPDITILDGSLENIEAFQFRLDGCHSPTADIESTKIDKNRDVNAGPWRPDQNKKDNKYSMYRNTKNFYVVLDTYAGSEHRPIDSGFKKCRIQMRFYSEEFQTYSAWSNAIEVDIIPYERHITGCFHNITDEKQCFVGINFPDDNFVSLTNDKILPNEFTRMAVQEEPNRNGIVGVNYPNTITRHFDLPCCPQSQMKRYVVSIWNGGHIHGEYKTSNENYIDDNYFFDTANNNRKAIRVNTCVDFNGSGFDQTMPNEVKNITNNLFKEVFIYVVGDEGSQNDWNGNLAKRYTLTLIGRKSKGEPLEEEDLIFIIKDCLRNANFDSNSTASVFPQNYKYKGETINFDIASFTHKRIGNMGYYYAVCDNIDNLDHVHLVSDVNLDISTETDFTITLDFTKLDYWNDIKNPNSNIHPVEKQVMTKLPGYHYIDIGIKAGGKDHVLKLASFAPFKINLISELKKHMNKRMANYFELNPITEISANRNEVKVYSNGALINANRNGDGNYTWGSISNLEIEVFSGYQNEVYYGSFLNTYTNVRYGNGLTRSDAMASTPYVRLSSNTTNLIERISHTTNFFMAGNKALGFFNSENFLKWLKNPNNFDNLRYQWQGSSVCDYYTKRNFLFLWTTERGYMGNYGYRGITNPMYNWTPMNRQSIWGYHWNHHSNRGAHRGAASSHMLGNRSGIEYIMPQGTYNLPGNLVSSQRRQYEASTQIFYASYRGVEDYSGIYANGEHIHSLRFLRPGYDGVNGHVEANGKYICNWGGDASGYIKVPKGGEILARSFGASQNTGINSHSWEKMVAQTYPAVGGLYTSSLNATPAEIMCYSIDINSNEGDNYKAFCTRSIWYNPYAVDSKIEPYVYQPDFIYPIDFGY